MHEAFPLLGQSYVGVELALARLRRMHMDSATITLHAPSEPNRPATILPVRLFADSALVGAGIHVRVAADGSILGLQAGPTELRRVGSLDMSALVDGFVRAFAPRVAALAAAAASRKEISLPTAQLDRFVGSYSAGATTIVISRDGDHLTLQVAPQPEVPLLAMSVSEFFVRKADLVVSFESDATGRVTGLMIAQGETKQRLVRRN
jgi:hypothetical protein